jgi:hypothetical protein
LHFMWRRVPRIKRFFVTPVEKGKSENAFLQLTTLSYNVTTV